MNTSIPFQETAQTSAQTTVDMMSESLSDQGRSRKSSVSSISSRASTSSAQRAELPLSTTATPLSQVDPLSRDYPQPTEEVNVAEMLSRKPMKWSVGHYITSSSRGTAARAAEDRQRAAQELDARKREFLAAKEELRKLGLSK